MAKTLVINDADFSTNKVETVSFGGSVPCTGISLDESTLAINAIGGTGTLTATATPSDTTDTISWTTSDQTVATVNNGVVTAVGIGTATITVTCGSYSATCSVTVSAFIAGANVYPDAYMSGNTSYSGGNGVVQIDSAGTKRGAILGESGTYPIYHNFHDVTYYPIPIPQNAEKIKVTYSNNITRIQCIYFCSKDTPASGKETVQLVDKIAQESITITNNVSIITIPQHEGYPVIDSVAVNLVNTNSAEFTSLHFNEITFEYLTGE